MNWGHKLTIGMVAFMLFISFMVYKMASSRVDLVADDYYEDGVEYQKRMEKHKNAEKFGDSLSVSFDGTTKTVYLTFPAKAVGKVYFYNVADRKNDFVLDITSQNKAVAFAQRSKGVWKASLDGTHKGVAFFYEKEFLVK